MAVVSPLAMALAQGLHDRIPSEPPHMPPLPPEDRSPARLAKRTLRLGECITAPAAALQEEVGARENALAPPTRP